MDFTPWWFCSGKPKAGFVGEAKCDGQNAHQSCQSAGVGYMGGFQSQAPCFQTREQRFDAPAIAIYGQRRFDSDPACGDNQHLPGF